MEKDFIDLGCGLDSPGGPAPTTLAEKKSYPCFYFTCDEKIDLPDGEFKFMAVGRKIEDSENTRDEENPRYRYEIEVHGFKPVGAAPKKKDDGLTNVGEALKKAMADKMKEKAGSVKIEVEEDEEY